MSPTIPPELPVDGDEVGRGAERLHALHREDEPDPLAALDGVQVVLRPDERDASRVLRDRAVTRRHLLERRPERCLRNVLERGVERTDLQCDAAGFELREPPARERVRLVVAEGELEQEVVVGVGDQRRSPGRAACSRTSRAR